MNRVEISKAIGLAQGYWPNLHVSKMTPEAWERLLGDLEFEAVCVALDRLAIEAPDFPPGPGVILKMATGLAVGEAEPDVDAAWSEVAAAIRRVGSYGSPEFTHPAITAAVEALGWTNLCMSENPVADRAHFLKIYDVTVRRAERRRTLTPAMAEVAGRAKALGCAVPDEPRRTVFASKGRGLYLVNADELPAGDDGKDEEPTT